MTQSVIDSDRLPTLTTERLKLRWLVDSDVPALFEVFSDPVVMRYWSTPPHMDEAAVNALLENIRDAFHQRALFQWGVARRNDDQIIGTCTLANLDSSNRRAELGFILGRDHWRKGYMTEALTQLLRFSFEDLGLNRLEADIDPRNASSVKLVEHLGFTREGYMPQRWIVGGEICDTAFFGLLAQDWMGQSHNTSRVR